MATNHHHHHHQCHCLPTPSPTTTTCYCTMCYTTAPYPPPPPPPPSHPLTHNNNIHSIHHTQHYNHHYPPPPQTHQNHHLFNNYYHQHNIQQNVPETETQTQTPTVSSLIHRIAALETTLLHRRKQSPKPSSSLRDAAARTIKTHFRAFLVRRSATLRHLKDLACIKSALNNLKSSVSNNTHFDSHALYRESMRLLVRLDSIQGSDPMIRDGKRAISRELIRFMELIDEMSTESQVFTVKSVRFGKNSKNSASNERKFLENLKKQRKYVNEVDERFNLENPRKAGVGQLRRADLTKSQPKVKKNVSFDENGNVYRLFKSSRNAVLSDGSGSSNGDGEEVEVEEIGVSSKETEVEEEESSEMSENEMDPRKNLRTRVHHTTEKKQPDQEDYDDDEEEDDSFVFSAPVPAKMEY